MPFLSPNQQRQRAEGMRQSTEGTSIKALRARVSWLELDDIVRNTTYHKINTSDKYIISSNFRGQCCKLREIPKILQKKIFENHLNKIIYLPHDQ